MENATKHIILYAEDDKDDLDLVKDAFSQYGDQIEIHHGQDGREALQVLQNLFRIEFVPAQTRIPDRISQNSGYFIGTSFIACNILHTMSFKIQVN